MAITVSKRTETDVSTINVGAETVLNSNRALAANAGIAVDVSAKGIIEIIMGPGQYHIDETVQFEVPLTGTDKVGSYLRAVQTSSTRIELTATKPTYIFEIIQI